MNNSFSPELINFIADRMHQYVLEMNKRINDIFHDLYVAEDNIGNSHLLEKADEARALREQLNRVLLSMEDDLRQQAHITSDMMEVYAPPELMGKPMAGSGHNDEVYPKNYQSSAQDSEQTIKEPDWKDGDTIRFCPQCHKPVSAYAAQCPICGSKLNNETIAEMKMLYATPDIFRHDKDVEISPMNTVYASPGIMNSLRSVFRNILSKKG